MFLQLNFDENQSILLNSILIYLLNISEWILNEKID